MNDLERDLQNLFEQRAREVDPAVLAPDAIVRRGRRRQARTVVGSVLAGVVAIVVAVAAIGSIDRPDSAVPGGPQQLPARTTTIGGVPVTAPPGWTLIDDTPMLNVVAVDTIDTCTFSGSGTEVDANGSPVASGPAPEPSTSCASAVADMPTGVPFLQLANFDVPLMESVCDWSGGPATPLPADGVAIYVASFPSGMDTQPLLDACPGSDHYGSITGSNASTFGLMTRDGLVGLTMAAVGVAGPGASDEDLAVARAFFEQPIFGQTNPYVTLDPNRVGPGYVLAAGGNAAAGWRLEAGITSSANNGRPIPGAILAIAEDGEERTARAAPAMGSLGTVEDLQRVGSEVVQWGTVSSRYSGVEIDGPDDAVTRAALYAWPQGLVEIADSQPFADPGSIWIATPPQEGTVTFVPVGDPIETGTPSPAPGPATQALDYTVRDSGAVVATGNDLGKDWTLTDHGGSVGLTFGGDSSVGLAFFGPGGGTHQDVDGGTFWISRQPMSTESVTVTADIAGNDVIAEGRWMPASADAMGGPGRVWVVVLPGSGSGYTNDGGPLPLATWWPSVQGPPQAGDATESWADQRVSGKLLWTDPACPVVEVVASVHEGDTGRSACLTPWDGGTPVIAGVYGQHTAVVVITGPENMLCIAGGSGGTVSDDDPFAHTGSCRVSIPVGETVSIQLTDVHDNPILGSAGRFTLHARPGELDLVS